MARVLIVDDEKSIRTTLGIFLIDDGYEVIETESAEDAVRILQQTPCDIVVSDIVLPKISGLELLHHIHRTTPEIKVILITGRPTLETAIAAVRSGAADYLLKPVMREDIQKAVRTAWEMKKLETANRQLLEENRQHREQLEQMIEERIEKLKQSEERYRSLFECSNDAIFIHDSAGRILQVNTLAMELSGYSFDELTRLSIFALHPPSEQETPSGAFREAMETGRTKFESKLLRKDGRLVDVEVSASIISRDQGLLQGIARDITPRKNAERALQISEQRFRDLLENVRLIAVMLNSQGEVTFCNPYLCDLIGYSPDEIKGKSWFDVALPPSIRGKMRELFLGNIEAGNMPSYLSNDIQTRTGEVRMISWNNTLLRDSNGIVIGVASLGEDVTERERALSALRESEERYRRLAENAQDMIWRTDSRGVVVYVNQAVERLLGYTPEESIGLPMTAYFSEKSISDIRQWIRRALDSNPPKNSFSGEVDYIARTGGRVPGEILATLLFDDNARVLAIEGISRDITERKQAEAKVLEYQQRLRQLASQLTLAEERQRRQIASLLHDSVCQDLALVKAQLKILKSKTNDLECHQVLDENLVLIQKAVDEARSLTYDLSPPVLYDFGLVAALQWLFDKMEANLNIKSTFFYPESPIRLNEELSVLLYTSVREVLVNIVKHAQADRITGRIVKFDQELQIQIDDNGIGFHLSPDQAGDEEPRGMGIFGIRERLYRYGGTMELISNPGEGTTVILSVPISEESKQ